MKEKIISITFVTIIFTFAILSIILKDQDISTYERRKLTTITSLQSDFITNLDDYLSDQFPLRNNFISLNSIFDRFLLQNIDSNSAYLKDNFIIEKNYPLNDKSLNKFIKKLNYIKDTYLKNNNVYYTIIPDKNYFLDSSKYLKIDYEKMLSELQNNLNMFYIKTIDLFELNDYYKTDIHIKQEKYSKMIKKLSNDLAFSYQETYIKKDIYDKFYGSSFSKAPIITNSDGISILTNETIESAEVKHLEYDDKKVYEMSKLNDMDSYNVFLSGPSALIEIENPLSKANKEIIIFRDSFASSFTPLLIPYYKKITLIDLRYIDMSLIPNYIDFDNKDILFAYSTLIVNSSDILKVNIR